MFRAAWIGVMVLNAVLLSILVVCTYYKRNELSIWESKRHNASKLLFSTMSESRNTTVVLILAYMRSGSSFLSQFFDANTEGFYVFEPLQPISQQEGFLSFPNGSIIVDKGSSDLSAAGAHIMENIFRCNIREIFSNVIQSMFSFHGKSVKKYKDCMQTVKTGCWAILESLCRNSSMRVIKTIRLRLYDARILLDRLPSLKILHLLRDPRGITHSRMRLLPLSPLSGDILCREMEADLVTYELFKSLYPGRVMQVLYESVASQPIRAAEEIYRFLGRQVPEHVKTHIKQRMSGKGSLVNHPFSTTRNDSAFTARQWRHLISWNNSVYLDLTCSTVYKRLGYRAFSQEKDLRNLQVPSLVLT